MDKNNPSNISATNTNPHDCWEIYQKVLEETKSLEDFLDEENCPKNFDDGEAEAEWLKAAGLGQLVEPWKQGREIQPEELGAALRSLSFAQAEAVKKRVNSLNHTVKQKYNQRQKVKKPDIRYVFKESEASSTGTRSRSATPDSLDSIPGETLENSISLSPSSASSVNVSTSHHESSHVPSFVSVFHRHTNDNKEGIGKLSSPSTNSPSSSLPVHEIFRRSGHWSHRGDIAGGDSEGIKLTAYQKLGTIHLSRSTIQRLNESDPSQVANGDLEKNKSKNITLRNLNNHATITRSHSSLYGSNKVKEGNPETRPLNRTSSHGHLSFEEMCKANEAKNNQWNPMDMSLDDNYTQQDIQLLSQRDFTKLQPLLWLELTSVFDKYNLPLFKRKPNKRKRKCGNVFGVSLSTLLLRDSQLQNDESNVPLVFQKILHELTTRGVTEEGILRVGGHKQKVEISCKELEADFFSKPQEIDILIKRTPCHDLSVILKKLLRDLPQPLLTVELIDAFYQTHGVKNPNDLAYSLNLLVLLLPVENRCTLKELLTFFKLVIENQCSNKMTIHNVAMIVAPSLFPPRYIYPRDERDLSAQVNKAAMCCQVTESIIMNYDKLWDVPSQLINQLHQQTKEEHSRRMKKKHL
ncbi:hypothetical protein TKK_0014864 [Trichogramma kaykai]|uniref:Rho-GAP domain-containing protein n=1 Tax=Trichogramma kaykai TaxID=54128 RepID=A0ABD2WBQ9_9HYME